MFPEPRAGLHMHPDPIQPVWVCLCGWDELLWPVRQGQERVLCPCPQLRRQGNQLQRAQDIRRLPRVRLSGWEDMHQHVQVECALQREDLPLHGPAGLL